jgi:hypothetical protein
MCSKSKMWNRVHSTLSCFLLTSFSLVVETFCAWRDYCAARRGDAKLKKIFHLEKTCILLKASGYFIYTEFYVLPTECIWVLWMGLKVDGYISYAALIDCPLITDKKCVYFEVQAGYLNKIDCVLSVRGYIHRSSVISKQFRLFWGFRSFVSVDSVFHEFFVRRMFVFDRCLSQ